MKKVTVAVFAILFCTVSVCNAGFFENLLKGVESKTKAAGGISTSKIISGLKEALSIGTGNAVSLTSKADGYFTNEAIKILMPDKIRNVASALKKIGFEKQVDDFILSMNRAAEKAAPQAKSIFINAVKEMSFEDAKKILDGGNTAATEYLKSKTFKKIAEAFKPKVSSAMDQVGVTRSYKAMMGKFNSLPFAKAESMDLDNYVSKKATDGLFLMVGEEEKKIRTNPTARVTGLLKEVFGRK